jgi:RadC-like JAB domain-containing protein
LRPDPFSPAAQACLRFQTKICNKVVSVSQGTLNEALAHPREVFKPVIAFSAYAIIMVHNHPSPHFSPPLRNAHEMPTFVGASRESIRPGKRLPKPLATGDLLTSAKLVGRSG